MRVATPEETVADAPFALTPVQSTGVTSDVNAEEEAEYNVSNDAPINDSVQENGRAHL